MDNLRGIDGHLVLLENHDQKKKREKKKDRPHVCHDALRDKTYRDILYTLISAGHIWLMRFGITFLSMWTTKQDEAK